MGVQTASVLYPVNTTTVDTGTGIDIRLLDSAQAGATDTSQSVTATHTQDNTTRIFDPASASNTATLSFGWGLRLAEDMTPSDDVNCNVLLPAQTASASIRVAVNQSGGTYVTGTYAPEWRAALIRYNVVTNVATIIGTLGTNTATSWNYTPATGDLGTFKNISISISLSTAIEFGANEILGLVLGVNTLTIPNPTLGTATWTYTLAVDDANTNLTLAGVLASVCGMVGTSSGSGDASGAMAIVLPTAGTSAGSAAVSGSLGAVAEMTGSAAGSSTATAALAAVGEMTGTAAGTSTASGALAGVLPTVGTCDIGAGGGTTINPVFCTSD